jgi:hypothetical protein
MFVFEVKFLYGKFSHFQIRNSNKTHSKIPIFDPCPKHVVIYIYIYIYIDTHITQTHNYLYSTLNIIKFDEFNIKTHFSQNTQMNNNNMKNMNFSYKEQHEIRSNVMDYLETA